jgi:putative endonuclease
VSAYYVHLLSNASRLLYAGITGNLERRVWEPKQKIIPGFTSRDNLRHLVCFEAFGDARAAVTREKQINR